MFISLLIYLSLFSFRYAIRDGNKIKIFKNFKERKSFKPEYGAESEYTQKVSQSIKPIHPSVVIYMYLPTYIAHKDSLKKSSVIKKCKTKQKISYIYIMKGAC